MNEYHVSQKLKFMLDCQDLEVYFKHSIWPPCCRPRETTEVWTILESGGGFYQWESTWGCWQSKTWYSLEFCFLFFSVRDFRDQLCKRIQTLKHQLLNGFVHKFGQKKHLVKLHAITQGDCKRSSWFSHINFVLTTLIATSVLPFSNTWRNFPSPFMSIQHYSLPQWQT